MQYRIIRVHNEKIQKNSSSVFPSFVHRSFMSDEKQFRSTAMRLSKHWEKTEREQLKGIFVSLRKIFHENVVGLQEMAYICHRNIISTENIALSNKRTSININL
jgi:hypothetical protein